jgi:hypothetical protein
MEFRWTRWQDTRHCIKTVNLVKLKQLNLLSQVGMFATMGLITSMWIVHFSVRYWKLGTKWFISLNIRTETNWVEAGVGESNTMSSPSAEGRLGRVGVCCLGLRSSQRREGRRSSLGGWGALAAGTRRPGARVGSAASSCCRRYGVSGAPAGVPSQQGWGSEVLRSTRGELRSWTSCAGGGGSAEERKREQGGLWFQGALRSWASCVGGGGSAEKRAGRVIRSGAGLD